MNLVNPYIIGATGGGSSLLSGLMAAWEMADTSDSSGNGNTLTNNNGVTFISGHVGSTGHFVRSSSQSLSIPDNAFVGLNDHDMTIEAWAKMADASADYTIVSRDGSGGLGQTWKVEFIGAAFLFTLTLNGSGAITLFSSGYPTGGGTWRHIIYTYNAATNEATLRADNGTPDTATVGPLNVSTQPLSIGANTYSGFENFANADIGPVRLWDRVLTGTEMGLLYNGGAGLPYSSF